MSRILRILHSWHLAWEFLLSNQQARTGFITLKGICLYFLLKYFFFFFVQQGISGIIQGLKFSVILPTQSHKYWDYKCVLLSLTPYSILKFRFIPSPSLSSFLSPLPVSLLPFFHNKFPKFALVCMSIWTPVDLELKIRVKLVSNLKFSRQATHKL